MKKELYSHFIYINSLFKTSELKLSTSRYLEVNELSAFRSSQRRFDLTGDNLEIKNYKHSNYNNKNLITALLASSIFLSIYQIAFTSTQDFILPMFSGALVLISLVLSFFLNKPLKQCLLYNTTEDLELYRFKYDSKTLEGSEIQDFVDQLIVTSTNEAEEEVVKEKINYFHINTEDQYSDLTYNLESLYNSGVLDDNTFNRIEKNINEKLFPNEYKEEKHIAEVIYLHNT